MTAAAFAAPCSAVAQSESYTPPPMFGDMTPPMVRPETATGNLVEPKRSDRMDVSPAPAARPPGVAPRTSAEPGPLRQPSPPVLPPASETQPPALPAPAVESIPTMTAPVPAQPPKMMQPIVEDAQPRRTKPVKEAAPAQAAKEEERTAAPTPRRKPSKAAAPEPDKVEAQIPAAPVVEKARPDADERTAMPKIRPQSQSVIQGPKTMPSIPASEVQSQETFSAAPAADEPTIMERHQTRLQEQKTAPDVKAPEHVVPHPDPNVTPSRFAPNDQGVLKKSILFKPGQIGMKAEDVEPIAAGVVNELGGKDKDDWRVQIRAFATPHGTGLSSDRRIALSRALSLRSALIERGVAASRIDVMAQGLEIEGGEQPGDRIDLYLYGKKAE